MKQSTLNRATQLEKKLAREASPGAGAGMSAFFRKVRQTPVERSRNWGFTSACLALFSLLALWVWLAYRYDNREAIDFVEDYHLYSNYRDYISLDAQLVDEKRLVVNLQGKGCYLLRIDSDIFRIGKGYHADNTGNILFNDIRQIYPAGQRVWFVGKTGALVSASHKLTDWRLHYQGGGFQPEMDLNRELTCLAVASDLSFFAVGTRQHGPALYDIRTHGWTPMPKEFSSIRDLILQGDLIWIADGQKVRCYRISRKGQRLQLEEVPVYDERSKVKPENVKDLYPIYDDRHRPVSIGCVEKTGGHYQWDADEQKWDERSDEGNAGLIKLDQDAVFQGLLVGSGQTLMTLPGQGLMRYHLSSRRLSDYRHKSDYLPTSLQQNTSVEKSVLWSVCRETVSGKTALCNCDGQNRPWLWNVYTLPPVNTIAFEGESTLALTESGLLLSLVDTSSSETSFNYILSAASFGQQPHCSNFGATEIFNDQLYAVSGQPVGQQQILRYYPPTRTWQKIEEIEASSPIKRLASQGNYLWVIWDNGEAKRYTFPNIKPLADKDFRFGKSEMTDAGTTVVCADTFAQKFWWISRGDSLHYQAYIYDPAERSIDLASPLPDGLIPLKLRQAGSRLYLWGKQNGEGVLYSRNKTWGSWILELKGVAQIVRSNGALYCRQENAVRSTFEKGPAGGRYFSGSGSMDWKTIVEGRQGRLWGITPGGKLKYYTPDFANWDSLDCGEAPLKGAHLYGNLILAHSDHGLYAVDPGLIWERPQIDTVLTTATKQIQIQENHIWALTAPGPNQTYDRTLRVGKARKELFRAIGLAKYKWSTLLAISHSKAPEEIELDRIYWSDFVKGQWVLITKAGQLYAYGLDNPIWKGGLSLGEPENIQSGLGAIWWLEEGRLNFAHDKNGSYSIGQFHLNIKKPFWGPGFWLQFYVLLQVVVQICMISFLILISLGFPLIAAFNQLPKKEPEEMLSAFGGGDQPSFWTLAGQYFRRIRQQLNREYRDLSSFSTKNGKRAYIFLAIALALLGLSRLCQAHFRAQKAKTDRMEQNNLAGAILDYAHAPNNRIMIQDSSTTWIYQVKQRKNEYHFVPETYFPNEQVTLSKPELVFPLYGQKENWKLTRTAGQYQLWRKTTEKTFHAYRFRDGGFLEDRVFDFRLDGKKLYLLTAAGLQSYRAKKKKLTQFSIQTQLPGTGGKLLLDDSNLFCYFSPDEVFQYDHEKWKKIDASTLRRDRQFGLLQYACWPWKASFQAQQFDIGKGQFKRDICGLMINDANGNISFQTPEGWRTFRGNTNRLGGILPAGPQPQNPRHHFAATETWTCHRGDSILAGDDIFFTFRQDDSRIRNPFSAKNSLRWPDETIHEACYHDDTLELATDYGLRTYVDGRLLPGAALPGQKVLDLEIVGGRWYCKTESGCYRKENRIWVYDPSITPGTFSRTDSLILPLGEDLAIQARQQTPTGLPAVSQLLSYDLPSNRFKFDQVNDLQNAEGLVWIATEWGIQSFAMENGQIVDVRNYLKGQSIAALRKDVDGNLYALARNGRTYRFEKTRKKSRWASNPASNPFHAPVRGTLDAHLSWEREYHPDGDLFRLKSGDNLLRIAGGKLSRDIVLAGAATGKVSWEATPAGLLKFDNAGTPGYRPVERHDLPPVTAGDQVELALANDSLLCRIGQHAYRLGEDGTWTTITTTAFDPPLLTFDGKKWTVEKGKGRRPLIVTQLSPSGRFYSVFLNKSGQFPFDHIQSVAASGQSVFFRNQEGIFSILEKPTEDNELEIEAVRYDSFLFNMHSTTFLTSRKATVFLQSDWNNSYYSVSTDTSSPESIALLPVSQGQFMLSQRDANKHYLGRQVYEARVNQRKLTLYQERDSIFSYTFDRAIMKVMSSESSFWVLTSRGLYQIDASLIAKKRK